MLRNTTARQIAQHWHDGQWSGLYQFGSSGVYLIENHLHYLKEVETNLRPDFWLHPGTLSKKNEKDLTNLKYYIVAQGVAKGLKTKFHKSEQYGYLIPYLSDDTPDELANKVKPVSYLK